MNLLLLKLADFLLVNSRRITSSSCLTSNSPGKIVLNKSADMAASVISKRRYSKKSLISGRFAWIDAMNASKTIATSTLEITGEGGDSHVLDFSLRYDIINDDSKLVVELTYLDGSLETGILLDFALSVSHLWSRQMESGEFRDLCNFHSISSLPASKNQTASWLYPYLQNVHQLTDDDFENQVNVKVALNLSINEAKPKLTDSSEPTLGQIMEGLCLNEDLSDIKIKCDGKEFPCHKLILSARSDVFKAMFQSDLKINENEESILEIADVSAETMKIFLKFIYRDDVKADDINLDLLIVADKYNVKRLVNICVKHLESIIDTKNVMEITFAAYLINNETLLQKASQFIFNNHGNIKKPAEWDQIKKSHPHVATKVMDLIVFEQDPSPQG